MIDLSNSQPINLTAWRVIQPGYHFVVEIPKKHLIWDICPPIEPIPVDMKKQNNFIDFTGKRYGRLTILGRSAIHSVHVKRKAIAINKTQFIIENKPRETGHCRWVVRCSCGLYELRSSSVIKKEPPLDRCYVCNKMLQSKRSEFYRNHERSPRLDEMEGW